MRETIATMIRAIPPHDTLEQQHIDAACTWIASGAPIYRIAKPDVPPQHLVSYVVIIDRERQQTLLVEHKNAGLWLPSGGHVEPDEHPQTTASRELAEELDITPSLIWEEPLFVTVTRTSPTAQWHTDVSLWYVFEGDSRRTPDYDAEEFYSVRWFAFDDIPLDRADPHMGRFMDKLRSRLAVVRSP